jgi:hypothetical protein
MGEAVGPPPIERFRMRLGLFAPIAWLALGASVVLAVAPHRPAASRTAQDAQITVRFSPHGGGEALAVETIGQARASILVQAYSFILSPC